MNNNTRACVAYIVGCLISDKKVSSVYDQNQLKHFNINGNVSSDQVNIYDYDRSCYVSGSSKGADLNLHDHGNGKPINITVSLNKFTGYDDDTSSHFRGIVNGGLISIFDYGESDWYKYCV